MGLWECFHVVFQTCQIFNIKIRHYLNNVNVGDLKCEIFDEICFVKQFSKLNLFLNIEFLFVVKLNTSQI
jgi:hypothetical protein